MSSLTNYLDEVESRADLCLRGPGAKPVSKKVLEQSQADVVLLVNIIRAIDEIFPDSPGHTAEIVTLAQTCVCDVCNLVIGIDVRRQEEPRE